MMKYTMFFVFFAAAAAIPISYLHEPLEEERNYSYKYAVNDHLTEDKKSHWEAKEGDKVVGSYRVVEPDGVVRTVDYKADGHNGFNAVVTREKHGHKEVTVHGHRGQGEEEHEEFAVAHKEPKYSYKYAVNDHLTEDEKSHWETREGDKVVGSYRVVEPDGVVRIVDYTADPHNGFRAVVRREKHGHEEVTVHGHEEHEDAEYVEDHGVLSGGEGSREVVSKYELAQDGEHYVGNQLGEHYVGIGATEGIYETAHDFHY